MGELVDIPYGDAAPAELADLQSRSPRLRLPPIDTAPLRKSPPRKGSALADSLSPETAFLLDHGFAYHDLLEAEVLARAAKGCPVEVLIAQKKLSRTAYEQALSVHCGAGWHKGGLYAVQELVMEGDDGEISFASAALVARGQHSGRIAISPQAAGYGAIAKLAARAPDIYSRSVFVTLPALRDAQLRAASNRVLDHACTALVKRHQQFSASRTATRWQIVVLAAVAAGIAIGMGLWPQLMLAVIGLMLTTLFLATSLLRAWCIARLDGIAPLSERNRRPMPAGVQDYPVYSIMAALYREAGQVADLVTSLDAIDWPESRRQVLLVCEADDPETIAAIKALILPEGFRLIVCPAGGPKTKPKALSYALTQCEGEFVVIYDAEDRPDRGQLREAWDRFRNDEPDLVCLQAPLVPDNANESWHAALFSLEYLAQFKGLLPVLESFGAPIPLGGTSNHFRTSVLSAVGGWDPYNVTEDADLGIRLARLGYRCGVLARPTAEEAPVTHAVWMRQRQRWMKGWMQTVLVHLRSPARVLHELGWRRTILFHLVITSVVISMLVHPLFMLTSLGVLMQLAAGQIVPIPQLVIGFVSVFNLVAGYTTYAGLARHVGRREGVAVPWRLIATLPVYWLLISVAGWRALAQLIVNPFHCGLMYQTHQILARANRLIPLQIGHATPNSQRIAAALTP